MPAQEKWNLDQSDRKILRELAKHKLEIADDPVNVARRKGWLALHGLKPARPMVLAEWGGVRDNNKPFSPTLRCKEEWARNVENSLLTEIWAFESLKDDHVVEPFMNVNWSVDCTDYGVQAKVQEGDNDGGLGARRWDPPLRNLQADFALLKPRSFSVNRVRTLAYKARMEEVFDGILPVRLRGGYWWTLGMTIEVIFLIGLEQLMLCMYDDPKGLHRLMAFMRDEYLRYIDWLGRKELFNANNENDYIGSGSIGYTPDLPQQDWRPGLAVRAKDQWVLLESQETVGVGPELFEEFIFQYQQPIAERFGLLYYGCCEPLHTRWNVVSRFRNLRAASIAPLCKQEFMAEAMGNRYVFSRKPNPTLISTGKFSRDLILKDLHTTIDVCRRNSCPLEIIMKDVHTLHEEPDRLARWVALAREAIEKWW